MSGWIILGYTENFVRQEGMEKTALGEMIRLLVPGGTLLITVPFGLFEDHGWFKNYDSATWQSLLSTVRPTVDIHELYFGYDPDRGWSSPGVGRPVVIVHLGMPVQQVLPLR